MLFIKLTQSDTRIQTFIRLPQDFNHFSHNSTRNSFTLFKMTEPTQAQAKQIDALIERISDWLIHKKVSQFALNNYLHDGMLSRPKGVSVSLYIQALREIESNYMFACRITFFYSVTYMVSYIKMRDREFHEEVEKMLEQAEERRQQLELDRDLREGALQILENK